MRDEFDPLTEPDIEARPSRPHLLNTTGRFAPSTTSSHGVPADVLERHRVAWVRISELVTSSSGRLVGRGLDLQSEVRRRLASSPQQSGPRRGLAPLSAFGIRTAPTTARTLARS